MFRKLAVAIALLLPAASALAEPLDIDLSQLGAPDAKVWQNAGFTGNWDLAAQDAKARFGILASELTLAVTETLLTPASTTGHSGFDIAIEGGYGGVHPGVVGSYSGSSPTAGAFEPRSAWPTHSLTPYELFVTGIRIRKALPFSIELGGRFQYISQSALWAGQLETKWAFFEGHPTVPDFALRIAYTRVGGVTALNLGATDFDFIISKRVGVLGVLSLTPYGALRFTYMHASSEPMVFFPAAQSATVTTDKLTASFPSISATFFRPTIGLRMTTYALSIAAEVTQYGGGSFDPNGYGASYRVKPTVAGAFRLGFEF